jgi:hypothetical protein
VPNWPSWPFATNQAPILAIGAYAHLHVQLGPPSFSTGTACAIVIFNSSESCHAF